MKTLDNKPLLIGVMGRPKSGRTTVTSMLQKTDPSLVCVNGAELTPAFLRNLKKLLYHRHNVVVDGVHLESTAEALEALGGVCLFVNRSSVFKPLEMRFAESLVYVPPWFEKGQVIRNVNTSLPELQVRTEEAYRYAVARRKPTTNRSFNYAE